LPSKIKIKLFASAREAVGLSELFWNIANGTTVEAILDQLVEEYPRMAPLKSSLQFAVNESFVPRNHVVEAEDEIAFIPPVSGG